LKRSKLTLVFLVLLLAGEIAFIPFHARVEASSQPALICRKTETVEVTYAPDGKVLSKMVSVRFEIYNNGSLPAVVDVVDRVRCLNASTFTTLYGTPKCDSIETFGNLTRLVWRNVEIDAGESLRFYYMAETFREIPVSVNVKLYINDKVAEVKEARGFYSASANLSDTIMVEVTLRNVQHPLFVSNRTVMPMLMCTVAIPFQNDYFSGLRTEPKANSTSFMSNRILPTWMLFLEDDKPRTVRASASIIKMSEWGEVPLEPVTIQISSAPEMLKAYLKGMIQNLEVQMGLMENFTQVLGELNQSTYCMYNSLRDIAETLQENSTEMLNSLLSFLNYTRLNLELANSTLAFSQSLLLNANSSLTFFMQDPDAAVFLSSHQNLSMLLLHAVGNLTMAYYTIDFVRNGNATVPGLNDLCQQISMLMEELDEAENATEQLVYGLYALADGLYALSNMTGQLGKDIEKGVWELEKEKSALNDAIFILKSKLFAPLDLEVKPSSFQLEWQLKVENTSAQILALNFSNNAEINLTVIGIKLVIHSSIQSKLKFEINLGQDWLLVDDLESLGIEYDKDSQTVYLWPTAVVEPNSSANVLTDWAGRQVRISLENGTITGIDASLDIAASGNLTLESCESQYLCSFNQPHIIVQNITWTPSTPPPKPTEKTLLETIVELLQRPETITALTATIIILALIAVITRKRKRKSSKTKVGEVDTSEILEEIEALERKLQNKQNQ